MKRITIAAALLAASFTTQASPEVYELKHKLCTKMGETLAAVAKAREVGVPIQAVMQRLLALNDADTIDIMSHSTLMVYSGEMSQTAAANYGYQTCMMEYGQGF